MEGPSYHHAERGGRRPRSRPTSGNNGISNSSGDLIHTALNTTVKRSSSSQPLFRTVTWILIVLSSSFLSFYIGIWAGIQASPKLDGKTKLSAPPIEIDDEDMQRRVEALAKQRVKAQLDTLCKQITPPANTPPQMEKASVKNNNNGASNLFTKSIQHFVRGMARVSKDDLMQTFDFGVPPNPDTEAYDALILYNHKDSLPNDKNVAKATQYTDPTKPLPKLTATQATENCETMNVVLMNNPGNTQQCFALVGGQYQSYHIQRWMRRPDVQGRLDATQPLKLTSRAWTAGGRQEFFPPRQKHVTSHQQKLLTYLQELPHIKARLKPILEKIQIQKTVVVLTSNHGHSELLMNFACSARARGFDLQNVLIFPTDLETKELADGMGLSTFYEEKLMASVPKHAAGVYGDSTFTSAMFAKVLCVQLVNELGYDLLFQDVDVVWYKNPLDFFHDKALPKFDLFFQDDGSRQERYAPYSANSGFYYVRSNERTRHFFRQLLFSSDLIDAWNSHQQVLIALLGEHSSVFGLSVKIFPKEMEEFPGGVQFHRWKEAMKKIMRGESKAYIFHMSWTENKDDKVQFFQQMGEWFLNPQCIAKEARDIATDGSLTSHCCSSEPLITCHYKDKPSKLPCPDSPLITEKGKAFFKSFTQKGTSFW